MAVVTFNSVADLKASTTPSTGVGTYWQAADYLYTVLAAGGSAPVITTAGGVLLRPVAMENVHYIAAWGPLPATSSTLSEDIAPYIRWCLTERADIVIPPGAWQCNGEITLSSSNASIRIYGVGGWSYLQANNTAATVMWRLPNNSGGFLIMDNLHFLDLSPGTTTWVRMECGTGVAGAGPVWKNTFRNCSVMGFGIATDYSYPGGTAPDWASENTFIACKFWNCRLGIRANNEQAYNNTYFQCDFENATFTINGVSDTDAGWPMLSWERGGGFNFYGCSIIGKGTFVLYKPANSAAAFPGAAINIDGCRVECRSAYGNGFFYQDPAGYYNTYRYATVNVTNTQFYLFGQSVNLVNGAGRFVVNFRGCNVNNGVGWIDISSVEGISATYTLGSMAQVTAENCGGIQYRRGTSTAWGALSSRFRPHVQIGAGSDVFNGVMTQDAYGFFSLRTAAVGEAGHGLFRQEPTRFRWYDYDDQSELRFRLPAMCRPYLFGLYKDPSAYARANKVRLYLVKDASAWAISGTFNYATDAYLIADTGDLANSSGYFPSPVRYPAAITSLLSGVSTGWLEGRLNIRSVATSDGSSIGIGGQAFVETL